MGMTPKQIQKALREKDRTMADIARRTRVTRTTVWKNVHKIRGSTSARVQKAIAREIGVSREDVFGLSA